MPQTSKSGSRSDSTSDRPTTTDAADPSVTSRGDDEKTPLNERGQRIADLLLVVMPLLLIAGYLLQVFGIHERSMAFAAAAAGVILTATGLLAVMMLIVSTYRTSRQTEVTEYVSSRD